METDTNLGHYDIFTVIGQSGMGKVTDENRFRTPRAATRSVGTPDPEDHRQPLESSAGSWRIAYR